MIQWHYTKMGLKQGPVPEDELRAKIRRGEISDTTLVWRDGMADWLPLSQVGELKSGAPANESKPTVIPEQIIPEKHEEVKVTPPALSMPVAQVSGSVLKEQPPAYHGDYVAPNIPSYLVPSIIGTAVSVVSMFLFCLAPGVITGIVAIVYAAKVDGLKAQGDIVSATSASKTAKVWMIVTYALLGLPVLVGIVFVIFAAVSG